MTDEGDRALIVGGGVGGLATAIGLAGVGIPATVLERSAELLTVGTGLQLAANGVRALQQLGLADDVQARGVVLERMQFRTWRGKTLIDVPLGELGRRYAIPVVGVSRADLLEVLFSALHRDAVRFKAECVGFREDGAGVTAQLADGREERGNFLVGADGLKSMIRAQRISGVEPRYAGYQYMRAITPSEHPSFPPATSWQFWGPGARFGLYPVGRGRVNWYAVLYVPEGSADSSAGRKQELLDRFRGWTEPVEAVIEATPEAAIQRIDIHDIEPLERWGEGRVTLMGDAAHATTPGLGRGASEALEDAAVLASCLSASEGRDDVATVLRGYEARRQGPTTTVTKRSWQIGAMGRWKNPIACSLREQYMRTIYGRLAVTSIEAEFARRDAGSA